MVGLILLRVFRNEKSFANFRLGRSVLSIYRVEPRERESISRIGEAVDGSRSYSSEFMGRGLGFPILSFYLLKKVRIFKYDQEFALFYSNFMDFFITN